MIREHPIAARPSRPSGLVSSASALNAGMKIGIITHYMPPHIGGIEIVADYLFRAYLAEGCEVRWIASRVPSSTAASEDGRIRVACLNWLEQFGIPLPIWGLSAMSAVLRLVKWADVLHVHDCLYPGSIWGVGLGRLLKKPVILSQHIGFICYSRKFINFIEEMAYRLIGKTVLRSATSIAAATPSAQNFLPGLLSGIARPINHIPNGIDTDRFRPVPPGEREQIRQALGLPMGISRLVLFVGRLVEKKGISLVIEVSRRLPEYHFLLVGEGPLRPPASDNVTWLPFVAPERMHLAYQAADVFLLPSHGEGLPVAVQEAMATGLPIIVSKEESFAKLLEKEKAGLLVERSAASLSGALIQVFQEPGLAVSLGRNARKLVMEKWGIEIMVKEYLFLIKNLTKKIEMNI
jgi:D-inositol-3-phosphate glycosyltransferase